MTGYRLSIRGIGIDEQSCLFSKIQVVEVPREGHDMGATEL